MGYTTGWCNKCDEVVKMVYKVYEWDFVLQKGELKHTEKDRGIAIHKGKFIAEGFCEDEKPIFMNMRNGVWIWDTNCDFGSKIFRVDE